MYLKPSSSTLVLIITLWACLLHITAAHAANCTLIEGGTARVTEIVDGDTVKLSTGKRVRLVGIQTPKLPLGRKGFKTQPLAGDAKERLAALILGKEITLKFGTTRMDRHKRLLAHIYKDGLWVQKEMITSGMARAYSFSDNRKCVARLLQAEKLARQKKRGIWRLPFYRIRQAGDIKELSSLHGTYQIVRGRVLQVSEGRGSRVYVNFGKNWKTDFTLTIFKSNRKYFKGSAYTLQGLEGSEIRVRGWLDFHNGPAINVTHAEQIEIVKR